MSKNLQKLVIVEMLLGFVPLGIGWALLALLSLFQMTMIGSANFHWGSLAFMVGLCVAGAIGGVALNAIRVFVFYERKRLIPRTRMIVFCAIGIVTLAVLAALSIPSMVGESADYFGVVYAVPLLCALHLLWLGRSYFTDR